MQEQSCLRRFFLKTLSFSSLFLVAPALFLTNNPLVGAPKKLHVVVTTSILGDAVKKITQGKAKVSVLMSAYVDPHSYEPSLKDTQKLLSADIIIYNGNCLEGVMQPILEGLAKSKKVIVAMDGISSSKLLSDKNYPEIKDPHFWMSVPHYIEVVNYISKKLQAYDPVHASFFKKNSLTYSHQLGLLHEEVKEVLQQVIKKLLVTAHDAYGYFSLTYGLKVCALQGLSTTAKFNLYTLNKLSRIIQKNGVKTIFLEDTVTHKNIQSLQQNLSQKGYKVDIGSSLPSDALGIHKDYLAMMRYIAKTLAKEL